MFFCAVRRNVLSRVKPVLGKTLQLRVLHTSRRAERLCVGWHRSHFSCSKESSSHSMQAVLHQKRRWQQAHLPPNSWEL